MTTIALVAVMTAVMSIHGDGGHAYGVWNRAALLQPLSLILCPNLKSQNFRKPKPETLHRGRSIAEPECADLDTSCSGSPTCATGG